MRSISVPIVSAWAAHAYAWAAGLFLAFGPVYSSASAPATDLYGLDAGQIWPGPSSSLVAQNGLYVVPLLLLPIFLTGHVLMTMYFLRVRRIPRRVLLWMPPVILLGCCLVAAMSIGVLYLPAALALLLAAATDGRGRTSSVETAQ